MYYGPPQFSKTKATVVFVGYMAMFAGTEAGFVYAIRVRPDFYFSRSSGSSDANSCVVTYQADVAKGSSVVLNFFGILSAVLLCGALLYVLATLVLSSRWHPLFI